MAKKPIATGFIERGHEKKRVKAPFGNLQFVLNNLDDGMLEDLEQYEKTPPDLYTFITDCVDKGIDVKIGHDAFSGGYQAVATGNWKDFPSEGYGTSGFSKSDAADALFVLWYKVAIVCLFDLSSAAGREKRTRSRG